MTSGHVQELLSPYIDDRVSPEDRERIARHLDVCEACRGDLTALQGVVGLVRSVPPVTAPEGLRTAIRSRVEQVSRSSGPRRARPAWIGRLPRLAGTWRPIAAAVAVVVIGTFVANFAGPQGARIQDAQEARRGGQQLKSGAPFNGPSGPRSEVATTDALRAPGTATRGAASPAPSTPGVAPSSDVLFRSVIRTARMAVEVERYDAGARRLLDIAEGAGGFIADSSYSEEDGRPQGAFTLRVPAVRFSAVVKDVEAMGLVRQRQISAQDVTEEFVDLQARQRNLERHEQQLLAFMDRATKVADLLAIEQELARVRGQIEQITGRLRYLSHNVEMASITVTLAAQAKQHASFWDFGATMGKVQTAFIAAVQQILVVAERVLVLGAMLLPVAALAAVAWAVIRRTRRAGAGA
jgi:hypothetical protein